MGRYGVVMWKEVKLGKEQVSTRLRACLCSLGNRNRNGGYYLPSAAAAFLAAARPDRRPAGMVRASPNNQCRVARALLFDRN